MKKRRVLLLSKSLYVSIPKQVCDLLGIRKGSEVGVELNTNNQILIVPVTAAKQETDTVGTHTKYEVTT